MLKAQVEQLLSSPKNAFHSLAPISGHALPASRLARTLKVSQSQIDALLADKDNLPARVITRGRVRYIVSDVAGRLANSASDEAPSASEEQPEGEPKGDTPNAAPTSDGDAPRGLFAETKARAAVQSQAARSCTGSGANAHRGDGAHGIPAEAKQSGT